MNTKTKLAIAACLVILGISGRLLPHAWNFAPIVAIGLFAGARLGASYGVALPALSMILSDIFIGFYEWQINISVYIAMALSGLIGLALRRTKNPFWIASGSIAGSTLFFLISNAAVWRFTTMYDPAIRGLFSSYVAGLPFLKNALVGDLWYALVFFGAYELASAAYRYGRVLVKHASFALSKLHVR